MKRKTQPKLKFTGLGVDIIHGNGRRLILHVNRKPTPAEFLAIADGLIGKAKPKKGARR